MIKYETAIKKSFTESIQTKERILENNYVIKSISNLSEAVITSLQKGGKVIFCGNGGSFADAQHLSAEFTSRFMFDRPSLPSLALGTNSSAMSAIANDYGYEHVFSRELSSIARIDDVFIGISTSGSSPNVLNAIEVAVDKGIYSALLTGGRDGILAQHPKTNVIQVPSTDTAVIQESHIVIGHIICGLVETAIFGNEKIC